MSTTIILLIIALGAIVYFRYNNGFFFTKSKEVEGRSYAVTTKGVAPVVIKAKNGRSYTARLKPGRKGKSYHDYDYYDELDHLIYDIVIMELLFDFMESDEEYFEMPIETPSDEEVTFEEDSAAEKLEDLAEAAAVSAAAAAAQEDISKEEIPEPEPTPTRSYEPDPTPSFESESETRRSSFESSSFSESSSSSSSFSDSSSSSSSDSGGGSFD